MVAARGVVEYGVVREIHDERVYDREGSRIEPGHVQLVVTNRNGHIIFWREFRADQRALYGNALNHRMTIRLLERVSGVPAQRVERVEHVPVEIEPLEAEVGGPGRRVRLLGPRVGQRRGGVGRDRGSGQGDRDDEPGRAQQYRLPECMLPLS